MADLQDLLARVEAATGPDQKLDALIEAAFTSGARLGDLDGCDLAEGCFWFPVSEKHFSAKPAEKLTASLDAALALVEREYSGGLGWWVVLDTGDMSAVLRGCEGEEFPGGGVGKDLPTALLAALLKAKIAEAAHG